MLGPITDVELLDLMVRLHDEPASRGALASGYKFHEAAAVAGLINRTDQDGFAACVGRAFQRGLLTFGSTAGGAHLRPPEEGVWRDHDLQSRYDYEPTAAGRDLALNKRRMDRLSASSTPGAADPSLAEARRLLADGARVEAVIEAVEGVLASHLRSLATGRGVSLTRENDDRPLSLSDLNNALRKARVYSASDQAQIQAWLHARNQLAHRGSEAPNDRRIQLLIDGTDVFVHEVPTGP